MRIAEKPLLKLEVFCEDGIRFEPKGPLAPLAQPITERINRIFRDEKPISKEAPFIFSTWIPPAPSLAFDRMLSAQVGAILKRRIPDQFSIAVIRGCPNRCIHCAAPSRKGDILEADLIKRSIGEALDLGSYLITFDGGEPMLREDLPQLVSSVDERAISACFTSGHGLSKERAVALKRAGLGAIRVSIDSPNASEHDRVRGRIGAFQDALSGVRNALDAGLLVDLFMVVSPSNIDDLDEAYGLAMELGAHELSLCEIVAVGRWSSHIDEVLSPKDLQIMERFHREKNRLEDGPRVTSLPHLMDPSLFGCFAGRRWMHVDASGEALPCAYMPLSFGNIGGAKLSDIWKAMGQSTWFSGRSACHMKDPAFRKAHPSLTE